MSNYRVPYFAGNSAGRDHQFWPVQDAAIVDADNVIVVNLATLMQMAWRVRKWTVSAGSMSFDPDGFIAPFSGSWDAYDLKMYRRKPPPDENDFPGREVTDERDILGPASDDTSSAFSEWPTLRNQGVIGTFSGFSDSPPGLVLRALGGFFGSSKVIYDPVRNLFSPRLQVGAQIEVPGGIVFFYSTTANDLAANPSFDAGGTLTVIDPAGGSNFVLPLAITALGPLRIPGSGTVSDITLTPMQWWPYANSEGLPVYDVTTGAQINDPFS